HAGHRRNGTGDPAESRTEASRPGRQTAHRAVQVLDLLPGAPGITGEAACTQGYLGVDGAQALGHRCPPFRLRGAIRRPATPRLRPPGTPPGGSTPADTKKAPAARRTPPRPDRSEEHTSELQSRENLVC